MSDACIPISTIGAACGVLLPLAVAAVAAVWRAWRADTKAQKDENKKNILALERAQRAIEASLGLTPSGAPNDTDERPSGMWKRRGEHSRRLVNKLSGHIAPKARLHPESELELKDYLGLNRQDDDNDDQ